MEVHEQLEGIFRDVFDDPGLVLTRATTAADIEGWDSLQHVNLLFRIEDELDFEFRGDEAAFVANVGELEDLIAAKGIK
jgi:acyl carrier protein